MNVLGTPVECPYASASVAAAEIVVSGIAAKERIKKEVVKTIIKINPTIIIDFCFITKNTKITSIAVYH